jgi:adenylate kinase
MSRGNKKRKYKGEPLKYKSKNVNYSAVDFAIQVGKNFYNNGKSIYKFEVNKYKSLFMGFITERKERNEEFKHDDAIIHALEYMD